MGERKEKLSGYCNLRMFFISERASSSIGVIEDDEDCGFGDSYLALFVDEFLKIRSPNLLQVGDFEDEANGIKNVGFFLEPFKPVMELKKGSKPGATVQEKGFKVNEGGTVGVDVGEVEAGEEGMECVRVDTGEVVRAWIHERVLVTDLGA
ncbi:hypothetical protein RJT34_16850 [Clitoria ternatea]|uniref:Uncharacterized protein n=1 Tax=Clitoria ternatea TaxID=43366 RepID=A0AAN9J7V1_CLITE